MQFDSRRTKIESLVAANRGIEPDRLQALVFLLQCGGEDYNYSFAVHHLRVFSSALQADIELLNSQSVSQPPSKSEIVQRVSKQVATASMEEVEAAAAFCYFQHKGYSESEIELALNADPGVFAGAKSLASFVYADARPLALVGP